MMKLFMFRTKRAFSLVEMLMALLVASLLMVALAPVMTKKFNEIVTISGLGERKYDPNLELVVFKDNDDFNIPNLVSRITVYMAGGGGAGGVSRYGKQEFTAPNNTFTVPDGVYKLRVFMVGGGGAGGGGGVGTDTVYADTPASSVGAEYEDFLTEGEREYSYRTNSKAPVMNSYCLASGVTKWTFTNDTSIEIAPGEYIPPSGETLTFKATGCGGGGGAGGYGGGGGGSGGYLQNKTFTTTNLTLFIQVGGGGGGGVGAYNAVDGATGGYNAGGGGGGVTYYNKSGHARDGGDGGAGGGHGGCGIKGSGGGNDGLKGAGTALSYGGTYGTSSPYPSYHGGSGGRGGVWAGGGGGSGNGENDGEGGGGGGGPTTITTQTGTTGTILFQAGGGGGGGGTSGTDTYQTTGGGGGGGGYGGGGGGGGTSHSPGHGSGKGGATYISDAVGGGNGNPGQNPYSRDSNGGGGGGGGGGFGGSTAIKTVAGAVTNVFGSAYCGGGTWTDDVDLSKNNGKPGALRLYYQAGSAGKAKTLKCEYNLPANGGAGGGGGQVWFGEIDVNPGDTLSITVGSGGAASTTEYAKKGGNGGSTIIVHNKKAGGSVTYKVVGGEGGSYEESVTSLSSARGKGGGIGDSMFNWNTDEISDSDFAALVGGTYGGAGGAVSAGAGGGKGGSTINRHGEVVDGPLGVASKAKGADATEYGTGGGGGGGIKSDETGSYPGKGGNGAQGYVYIEWGGTNGGGGTAGEFVKKSINNLDNDDRALHITIGKGGDNSDPVGLGNGGVTTVSIKTGKGIVTQNAAGGMRGTDGGAQTVPTKVHGGETAPTWTIQDYKNFITPGMEAVVNGKAGSDDFGGIGGRLEFIYKALLEDGSSELQATVTATDGSGTVNSSLPGCGGASNGLQSDESDCNPSADGDNSPNGGDGRSAAGGGGGAVRGENAGKGGKGGDGFVILEYKSLGM